MVRNPKFVMMTTKADLSRVDGDARLFFWYSVLKDYGRRFKKDKYGFIRVPSELINQDYGYDRVKVWRYNKELEDKGLIKVDRVHRGGRTWIGYKIV